MGALSRLTGDSRFERAALRALRKLWSMRSSLNLLGTTLNVLTGEWIEYSSGIGAGNFLSLCLFGILVSLLMPFFYFLIYFRTFDFRSGFILWVLNESIHPFWKRWVLGYVSFGLCRSSKVFPSWPLVCTSLLD